MARSLQQIEQELQTLEKTVAEFTQELDRLYSSYLEQLGQSIEQQLILASYQLCTQIYPDSFLSLSLNQRQELQQSLRKLGKDIKPALLNILENHEQEEDETSVNIVEEIIKNIPISEELPEDYEISDEVTISETKTPLRSSSEEEAKEIIDQLQNLSSELSKIEPHDTTNPHNPENLIRRQQKIEFRIKKSLDSVSRKANKLLQDTNVVPNRLPSKVLEIAIAAENGNSPSSKFSRLANIINLAIDTGKEKKQQIAKMMQISLLRLRLSEIEFADTILNAKRGQIRNLLKQVNNIKQRYRNLQKEYAKVKAEAAWRSSWYEE